MRTFLPIPLLLACAEEPTTGAEALRAVVLVVDGARVDETLGDGFSTAAGVPTAELMPAVREGLLPLGLRATRARNLGVPITTESHTELLTRVSDSPSRRHAASRGEEVDGAGGLASEPREALDFLPRRTSTIGSTNADAAAARLAAARTS